MQDSTSQFKAKPWSLLHETELNQKINLDTVHERRSEMESSSLFNSSKRPDLTQTLIEELKNSTNDLNEDPLVYQAVRSQLGTDKFN